MRNRFSKLRILNWAVACGVVFTLTASAAHAQTRIIPWQQRDNCPPGSYVPWVPSSPDGKTPDGKTPDMTTPQTEPSPGPVTSAALGDSLVSFGPGYIDNPVPYTHFRLRFDSAYRDNRPDRAEYFYAKCGCFPGAPGPPAQETRVDYQDVSAYFEYATSDRFSMFVEFPYRFLNPVENNNTSGFADMNFGFKYRLFADCNSILTFQGRVFCPTGDADRGLGTDHFSLEPMLLYGRSLSDKLLLYGELGDWIPVGGTDFSGNILRYGIGMSYTVMDNGQFRAAPVLELMGWTVLGGKEFIHPGDIILNAAGDTIINAKFGLRLGFGSSSYGGLVNNSDLYIGYGRALTGEVWYKDILRVEYRLRF